MVVKCPGCAFAQPGKENHGLLWTQGVDNGLYLNISVGSRPETLELNGVQFYPPLMNLDLTSEAPVPYIAQVPSVTSLVDIKSNPELYTANPLRLTSWSLQAGTSHTVESGEEILTIHLQLSALERQPINTPEITIQALKNIEGQLLLLKVETSPIHHSPEKCNDWPLLCKWRAIIASKFHGFKGFKGMKPHGCHKGAKGKGIEGPPSTNMHHGPDSHHDGAGEMDKHHGKPHGNHTGPPHHGKPHHEKPNHGKLHHGKPHHGGHRHHHHHKIHRVLHVIGRILLTVFVPILLGVAAGMITYGLGMFLGASIALLWTKVRPARYQRVALSEEEAEAPRGSIDKAEFLDEKVDIEAPPQYAEVEGKEIK